MSSNGCLATVICALFHFQGFCIGNTLAK
jgi:hypothetical protein